MMLNRERTRINAAMMPTFQGQSVTMLGKARDPDANGRSFKLDTCDDQEITINLQEPLQDYIQGWVEVDGTVQGKSINSEHLQILQHESEFDFDKIKYNKAVEFMSRFKDYYKTGMPEQE